MAALGGDTKYEDKLDSLFMNRKYLAKHEYNALQYWKEPDWSALSPVAICCDGDPDLGGVWNYYRHLISSEPQGGFPAGRSSFWMVVDEHSQGFLGVFAYTSFAQSWPHLETALGWEGRKDLRLRHRKHIQFLARCLPSETFGDLLGGKLLALMATSENILRQLELRYSLPIAGVGIATLHGKGSQYNRLDKEGIQFWGEDTKGRGTYFCECREWGRDFLGGDLHEVGPFTVPTLARRIAHWRERWYEKRLRRFPPRFDSKLYTLGRFL